MQPNLSDWLIFLIVAAMSVYLSYSFGAIRGGSAATRRFKAMAEGRLGGPGVLQVELVNAPPGFFHAGPGDTYIDAMHVDHASFVGTPSIEPAEPRPMADIPYDTPPYDLDPLPARRGHRALHGRHRADLSGDGDRRGERPEDPESRLDLFVFKRCCHGECFDSPRGRASSNGGQPARRGTRSRPRDAAPDRLRPGHGLGLGCPLAPRVRRLFAEALDPPAIAHPDLAGVPGRRIARSAALTRRSSAASTRWPRRAGSPPSAASCSGSRSRPPPSSPSTPSAPPPRRESG